jgi:hypothetical protein
MKKIYSFVLMAAMLLVGTSAWAGQVTVTYNSGTYAQNPKPFTGNTALQDAINSVQFGDSATITLMGEQQLTAPVCIPAAGQNILNQPGKRICIDMNGQEINETGLSTGVGCFRLVKGTLHFTGNGTINHNVFGDANNAARSAIIVFGAPWEKKTENWSNLILDKDVNITTASGKLYGITLDVMSAILTESAAGTAYGYFTGNLKYASAPTDRCSAPNKTNTEWSAGCAYGVRIILDGDVYGHQRGINVAGNINASPECDPAGTLFPYIKIGKESEVSCYESGMTSGNGGIYAGGYTIMNISGNVHGQTGILVKSGDITLDGATVASDAAAVATDGNYTGNVSGSGIFIASDNIYAGNIEVSLEGGTQVTGGGYAAIVDVCATNTGGQTQVEHIDFVDAKIKEGSGDNAVAIVLTTGTAGKTDIINATVDGEIQKSNADGSNPQTMTTGEVNALVPSTNITDNIYNEDADYYVKVDTTDPTSPAIVVKQNTSKVVELNDYGYATFSVVNKTRAINSEDTDLKVYKFEAFDEVNGILTITPLSGVIPQNTGVIFKGVPGKKYILDTHENVSALESALKPAAAWSTIDNVNTPDIIEGAVHNNVYVLSGDHLYKYEGANMKVNKAYLDLGNSSAPKRIQMVITETQDIENVEFEAVKAVKFIENGQVLIKRGETIYNVQGQIVK